MLLFPESTLLKYYIYKFKNYPNDIKSSLIYTLNFILTIICRKGLHCHLQLIYIYTLARVLVHNVGTSTWNIQVPIRYVFLSPKILLLTIHWQMFIKIMLGKYSYNYNTNLIHYFIHGHLEILSTKFTEYCWIPLFRISIKEITDTLSRSDLINIWDSSGIVLCIISENTNLFINFWMLTQ